MKIPERYRARCAELDAQLREWGETRTTPWRLDPDGYLRCETRAEDGTRYEVSASAEVGE